MSGKMLVGRGTEMGWVSREAWEDSNLRLASAEIERALGFMSEEHHRVRNLVVRELPRQGKPLTPAWIARQVSLAGARVTAILDELEAHLTFLYRNREGAVAWAYPVTVERTPHHLSFSSGERIYAAWAVDAVAAPFVQGRLREEFLSVHIETECAHCRRELQMAIDSTLQCRLADQDAEPLVFRPEVDFENLTDPSIIDAFWRNSVFFWSEEHAREHRASGGQVDGTYLTIEQGLLYARVIQGALFAFKED